MRWASQITAGVAGAIRLVRGMLGRPRIECDSDRLDLESALDQVDVYLARGQFQDVIRIVDRLELVTANPRDIHSHWFGFRALAQDATGEVGAAIRSYEQALENNAADPIALMNLATIFACSSDEQYLDGPKAVGLARKACDLNGEWDWRAWQCLASTLARTGEFRSAEEALAKARRLVPRELEWRIDRLAGCVGRQEAFTFSREERAARLCVAATR